MNGQYWPKAAPKKASCRAGAFPEDSQIMLELWSVPDRHFSAPARHKPCGVEARQWGKGSPGACSLGGQSCPLCPCCPYCSCCLCCPCCPYCLCCPCCLCCQGARHSGGPGGSPLCQHHTGLGCPFSWRPGTWQLLYSPVASSQCQSYPGYFELSYLVFEKGCLLKSKSEVLGTPDSQRL